jgi:hypothetical protein
MSFPKTAIEALEQIKSNPNHGFKELILERECYGATPYLSGLTDQGWCVLWSVEMLGDD